MTKEEAQKIQHEIEEYEDKMKTKRLDAMEQERYKYLIYLIQEYLANE